MSRTWPAIRRTSWQRHPPQNAAENLLQQFVPVAHKALPTEEELGLLRTELDPDGALTA